MCELCINKKEILTKELREYIDRVFSRTHTTNDDIRMLRSLLELLETGH